MTTCQLPPAGWSCSREAGHEGPCAASPTLASLTEPTISAADLGQTSAPAEVALPWYKSHTVLGILAAIILTFAQRYGLLGEVTQDQLVQALFVVIPMLVALYGRLTTTRPVVTATARRAEAINSAASTPT